MHNNTMTDKKKISILDSTLRDGSQGEGISYSVQDKINIVLALDELGVTFIEAGNPEIAEKIYQYIIEECKKSMSNVQVGIFGADMKISLVNDGPFTIILDSKEIC